MNWKNVTYKAKMIFCYKWWNCLKDRNQLPFHFSRHMLYIKDVESYLFEEDNTMKNESQWVNFKLIPFDKLNSLI